MHMSSFLKENRGQLSAELIIILAALIAVAAIVITQLTKTTNKASEKIDTKTNEAFDNIDKIGDYN